MSWVFVCMKCKEATCVPRVFEACSRSEWLAGQCKNDNKPMAQTEIDALDRMAKGFLSVVKERQLVLGLVIRNFCQPPFN